MWEKYQCRESLYTAASRGKKSVALFGEASKIEAALLRSSRSDRVTRLAERLVAETRGTKRPRDE